MLQYLVERLPVMICPKWVATMSQPIAVDDVITYLVDVLKPMIQKLEPMILEVQTFLRMRI